MSITKKLMHKLFIAGLIMITMTDSHQLNAMEQQSASTINETSLDADFQAYLVLSTLGNDHDCYLFPELVQIITINTSKLVDRDYYKKYGGIYLNHPNALLYFIENRCNDNMNHTCIANILKRCLNHIGKSLSEIRDIKDKGTVFHYIGQINYPYYEVRARVNWIKILGLVARSETWNIICKKDTRNHTPLHYGSCWTQYTAVINELLSAAPNPQKAWDLIITPDKNGNTVLAKTIEKGYFNTTELLESYRSKEQ